MVFILDPTVHKRRRQTGTGPQEGHKDDLKGLENPPYEKRQKEFSFFSLEKAAQGDFITAFYGLKGSCEEDGGSLHIGPHGGDMSMGVSHTRRGFSSL